MKMVKILAGLPVFAVVVAFSAYDCQAWTVRSQVFDADGATVEGATVTMLGSATCPMIQVSIVLNATTNREGLANVMAVPDGCFQLEVTHPELGTVRQRVGAVRGDVNGVRLQLPGHSNGFAGWKIGGIVCTDGGEPMSNVHVMMIGVGGERNADGESAIVHTDDQGAFLFEHVYSTTGEIHVIEEGCYRAVSRWSELNGDRRDFRMTCMRIDGKGGQSQIEGRVVDAYGSSVEAAHIVVLGMLGNGIHPEIGTVVHSNDEGRFSVSVTKEANYGIETFSIGLGANSLPLGQLHRDLSGVSIRLPGGTRQIGDAGVRINPISIDFTEVGRGVGKRLPVTIYNAGQTDVNLAAQRVLASDGSGGGGCGIGGRDCVPSILPFYISLGGGSIQLAPGALHTTLVCCYPYNFGPHQALLQLEIDSPESATQQIPLNAVTLGLSPDRGTVPGDFGLINVYPNPFNNSTTIEFNLPSSMQASLQILDVCGRSVATLLDGVRPAGSGSVSWSGEDSPGGIYYARLQSGELVSTRKVALVK